MITNWIDSSLNFLAENPHALYIPILAFDINLLDCIVFEIKSSLTFFFSSDANLAGNYDQWRQLYKISQIMDNYYPNPNQEATFRRVYFNKSYQPKNYELFTEIHSFDKFSSELKFYEQMSEEQFFRAMYDEKERCWTSAALSLALKIKYIGYLCDLTISSLKQNIQYNKRSKFLKFVFKNNDKFSKAQLIWLDYNVYNEYKISLLFHTNKYLIKVCNENLFDAEKVIQKVNLIKKEQLDEYLVKTGNLSFIFRKFRW